MTRADTILEAAKKRSKGRKKKRAASAKASRLKARVMRRKRFTLKTLDTKAQKALASAVSKLASNSKGVR